jgi:hypothetical protein
MYTVLAVCSTVATLLYVIFILMARQAINRCIAIVREVTRRPPSDLVSSGLVSSHLVSSGLI